MVRLHPGVFAIAVAGASVFALCTVASSFAVRWVIDHVILPRFEEGEVAVATVVGGIALLIGIGVVRAAGVVVRRTFAGITQWRVAQTLADGVIDRLVRQPVPWHQRRADGELVARAGVDADAAVSVLAPIPFATSTVLMIVVAGCVDDRDRRRARPRRGRGVPDPDRPQHRLPASCRSPLQRGAGPARGVVGRRARELRRRAAHQGLRCRGARDRAIVDDRRPHPRRPDQCGAPARHVRGCRSR